VKPVLAFALACSAQICFSQEFPEIRVEKIVQQQKFTEGPVWSLEGFLLFSDTVTDKIQKFMPGKGASDYVSKAGGAAGNAYDEQGRLYACEFRERRITRTDKKGKVDIIASKFEGKRFNAPLDVVVRRDGNVYFTDPAFGNQQDTRELDFYGVFHVTPKGEIEAISRSKTRPHGVALAPNGRTLYVSDADTRSIRAYDLDRSGAASNERVIVNKLEAIPGGIRTDDKGNLYVAAKGVDIFTPKGELLKQISLAEPASNLAFGDSDFATLFVTARTSVYRIRLGSIKGSLQYAPSPPQ
jgi:gluconolactonase